jgi:hypothetical protein
MSPSFGGGVTPLYMRFNFNGVSTDDEGDVIVLRVNGGVMPVYIGVLVVASGATTAPSFITSFTTSSSFNKDAIPDYHGASGTPQPTNTPPPGSTNTPTPLPTNTRVPTNTRMPTSTPPPGSTSTPTNTPCSLSFSDVHPTDYFYTPVQYLACGGAISGYSDGTFRPYNDTTRGQLSKIAVLAEGWPIDTTGAPHFTDVPSTNPFYAFVETAYNRGVIGGYSDNTFRPGNNVTRAQLSKIIVVAQGWPIDTTGGPHFTDVPTGNPFYAFIETAYNRDIISGYSDGTFRWGNNATRGQISKIVYSAVTAP